MIFEWDENKNRINKARHRVSFEAAATVFNDPNHISRIDRDECYEERWQTLGNAEGIVLLFVSHTYEDAEEIVIRIISAREAMPGERKQYEKRTF
jgi:uncharacterized DUF497 family protein